MSFNTALYETLKQGSITNIVFFGTTRDRPPLPYVVIKKTQSVQEGFYDVQFFIHGKQGTQEIIQQYALRELPALINNSIAMNSNGRSRIFAGVVDSDGTRYPMFSKRVYIPDLAISDDDSISCRCDYSVPIVFVGE